MKKRGGRSAGGGGGWQGEWVEGESGKIGGVEGLPK